MRRFTLLIFLSTFLVCCNPDNKSTNAAKSLYKSESATTFHIRFATDSTTRNLIKDSIIFGSGAKVALKTVVGLDALEIRTDQEFSDAFLDLEKLFGHTIDFSQARYISMKILLPKESWITALKFNFKDVDGNFGGCNEITNNFYGNYDQWLDVAVDMQQHLPDFKNWHGDESPLPRAKFLSLNPYNAHQADSSSIYVHSIKLSDKKPEGNFIEALAKRPVIEPNNPYTITFDDEELTRRQMAIRAFESTYQAMSKNIAGNKSMSIRLKGKELNKHLAFLPILDKLTGNPVDFTKVKRLKFSYYLTDDRPDFDGACLYLANEHWKSVLYDKTAYTDFKKGKWTNAVIEMDNLNLDLVRGEESVLPSVYEIRMGLNYRPGQKSIEMWLDNFGWE